VLSLQKINLIVERPRGGDVIKYTKRYFMSGTSNNELVQVMENANSKPKLRQKCMNELIRRGFVRGADGEWTRL
jgi:hypothetical protein